MKYPTWLKNFVWNLDIVKTVRDNAVRSASMDAYSKAHADILETMADDLDAKAEALAEQKLSQLLSIVDKTKIVTQDRAGRVFIGGSLADENLLNNLKSEADFLVESELWKLIHETPKQLAQLALFKDDGKSEIVHTKGRAILFTLDVQKKLVDKFRVSTSQQLDKIHVMCDIIYEYIENHTGNVMLEF